MTTAYDKQDEIRTHITTHMDGTYQMILHLLNHANLLCYGGSVFGSWIEPEGEELLADIASVNGDGEAFLEAFVQADYDAGIEKRKHTDLWYNDLGQCSSGRPGEVVELIYAVLKELNDAE